MYLLGLSLLMLALKYFEIGPVATWSCLLYTSDAADE